MEVFGEFWRRLEHYLEIVEYFHRKIFTFFTGNLWYFIFSGNFQSFPQVFCNILLVDFFSEKQPRLKGRFSIFTRNFRMKFSIFSRELYSVFWENYQGFRRKVEIFSRKLFNCLCGYIGTFPFCCKYGIKMCYDLHFC